MDHTIKTNAWNKIFNLEENGGYVLTISFEPKNRILKFLNKLGFIKPECPIVEKNTIPFMGEYICLEMDKKHPLEAKGVFWSVRGQLPIKVTIPTNTAKKFDIYIRFNKLYS